MRGCVQGPPWMSQSTHAADCISAVPELLAEIEYR